MLPDDDLIGLYNGVNASAGVSSGYEGEGGHDDGHAVLQRKGVSWIIRRVRMKSRHTIWTTGHVRRICPYISYTLLVSGRLSCMLAVAPGFESRLYYLPRVFSEYFLSPEVRKRELAKIDANA